MNTVSSCTDKLGFKSNRCYILAKQQSRPPLFVLREEIIYDQPAIQTNPS